MTSVDVDGVEPSDRGRIMSRNRCIHANGILFRRALNPKMMKFPIYKNTITLDAIQAYVFFQLSSRNRYLVDVWKKMLALAVSQPWGSKRMKHTVRIQDLLLASYRSCEQYVEIIF